jgi:hypothetical protein
MGIEDTPLLADFWPHGGVAQAYGIFREKNDIPHQGSAGYWRDPQGAGRFIVEL